jgi:hypothetical protein
MFAAQTGTTPARFVERIRVEAARERLESTATPIETVAADCGFGSSETMRRAFLRVIGVGPSDYRARFRSGAALDPRAKPLRRLAAYPRPAKALSAVRASGSSNRRTQW